MYSFFSVNYRTDELLKINTEFLSYNNPDLRTFIIVENEKYKYKHNKVVTVDGIDRKTCYFTPRNKHPNDPKGVKNIPFGGNHHGAALDVGLSNVKTKYGISYDADYFCVSRIKPLIEYMELNDIDIMGPPYGYANSHKNIYKSNMPAWHLCPHMSFSIINLDRVNDISFDPRKCSDKYFQLQYSPLQKEPYSRFIMDAGVPFYEYSHQYKKEQFTICFNEHCNICNSFEVVRDMRKVGDPLEVIIFNNKIVGLHIHSKLWGTVPRKFTNSPEQLSIIERSIYSDFDQEIYHPHSCFIRND